MKKTIAIVGSLDTKGEEFAFLKAEIEKRGCGTLVVDTGVLGEIHFEPDVSREQVAQAGGSNIKQLIEKEDRSEAMAVMTAMSARTTWDPCPTTIPPTTAWTRTGTACATAAISPLKLSNR